MPDARYTVVVPTVDGVGNPLVSVAQYAHQYLHQNYHCQSRIEHGKTGMAYGGGPQTVDDLVAFAEETPEMDSAIKQLGAYVGEICNQPAVLCLKEGKSGPVRWEIANSDFRPGQPAEQIALAQRQAVGSVPAYS